MATKIRLKRIGKKKQAYFRIVVADSRSPRDGKTIEWIGSYNPNIDPPAVKVKEERLVYWLEKGALLSPTVESILKNRIRSTKEKTKE